MHFTVAGAMTLTGDGGHVDDDAFGGRQQRLVTAMLLLERHDPVGRESVASQVWVGSRPARWQTALRVLVSQTRHALTQLGADAESIRSRAGRYLVELPSLRVDVEEASEQADEAGRLLAAGRRADAHEAAGQARSVLSRPVLAGVEAPWVDRLRDRLRDRHVESLLVLAACRVDHRPEAARRVATEAVELAPLREDTWRRLMDVQARTGNTAAALRAYEDCRRLLADELGADPDPATQELHVRILRSSPRPSPIQPPSSGRADETDGWPDERDRSDQPAPRSTTGSSPRVPYVGLRPFGADDADLFFGRDADVQELVRRLERRRTVSVVGPSGVGKSSLVLAGLLPALARGAIPDADTWRTLVVVPGTQPAEGLADALDLARTAGRPTPGGRSRHVTMPDHGTPHGSGHRPITNRVRHDPGHLVDVLAAPDRHGLPDPLLVVIDQAEELFTTAAQGQASQVLKALRTATGRVASRVSVVLTMRADFYGTAVRSSDMGALLSRSQFVVPTLSGDGLERAIRGPAQLAGLRLETGVLGHLLADGASGPGRLPLLQHTLWELWQHREGDTLTMGALERIGGVAGALAHRAERTWRDLDPQERRRARRILLRGVHPTEDFTATTRPIERADLDAIGTDEEIDHVLSLLVQARLLTASRSPEGHQVVQLAHEALVEAWPRLRGWVQAQHAHLLTAQRLATAAAQWERENRHEDWLLRGRRLADAEDLAAGIGAGVFDLVLSPGELTFLDNSVAARQAAERARAGRIRRERELERSAVRRLTTGLALASAENVLARDPELALLLALEVTEEIRTGTPELSSTWLRLLHQGLARHRLLARFPDAGPLLGILPDGRLVTLAPADDDGRRALVLRDPESAGTRRAVGHTRHLQPPQVIVARTAPVLAVGDEHGTITTYDLDTFRPRARVTGPRAPVGALAVAPDGSRSAALWLRSDSRQLIVHDLATGAAVHRRDPVRQPFANKAFEHDHQLDFHPSGRRLLVVTGSVHSRLQLLDVDDWKVVEERRITPTIMWVSHTADGRHIGVAHRYGISIHDARTLEPLRTLRTPAKTPAAVWIRDDRQLLAAGGRLRPLDREDQEVSSTPPLPRLKARLPEDAGDRTIFAIPGREEVVTGRRGRTDLLRWDVAPTSVGEVTRIITDPSAAGGIAWSPTGDRLAVAPGEGWIALRDTASFEECDRFRVTDRRSAADHPPHVDNITWSPDGEDVVSIGTGGMLLAWDVERGRPRFRRQLPTSFSAGDTAVSPDGSLVAAASGAHVEVLTRDGGVLATLASPQGSLVEAVVFSPDGEALATTHWPTGLDRPEAQGATVWDWRRGVVRARFAGTASNLSFGHDGVLLAVSLDATTVLWDWRRDRVVRELLGHRGWVQDVTHSPDGSTIATCGWDGAVRLWDAETGDPRLHVTALHRLHRVAFHPARPWLALNESPGAVHVWTLDTDELVDIARRRVTRTLTEDERARHLRHQ